jgi:hypothetical protein
LTANAASGLFGRHRAKSLLHLVSKKAPVAPDLDGWEQPASRITLDGRHAHLENGRDLLGGHQLVE